MAARPLRIGAPAIYGSTSTCRTETPAMRAQFPALVATAMTVTAIYGRAAIFGARATNGCHWAWLDHAHEGERKAGNWVMNAELHAVVEAFA